ncbi:hypothetical protein P8452_04339 [Trifolium repens]|nr:hypothetical protein P8452_04339 [Trifolium repens]
MTDSGDSQRGRSKISSEMLKMADNDNTKGKRKSPVLDGNRALDGGGEMDDGNKVSSSKRRRWWWRVDDIW